MSTPTKNPHEYILVYYKTDRGRKCQLYKYNTWTTFRDLSKYPNHVSMVILLTKLKS
jgi:hypothetical protein